MRRRMFRLSLFGLITSLLLVGGCGTVAPTFECTDAIGCVTIAPDEPIAIGVLQDLSSSGAILGQEQVKSIDFAIAQRDTQLLGHPIATQVEDSRCTPEGGANAALRVLNDPQLVAILGTSCSSAAVEASRMMSEAGLVMISGANAAPSLTEVGEKAGADWQPGYFRTTFRASIQGEAIASFVFNELGITRAASLNADDSYSQGTTEIFDDAFTALGGEITLSAGINKGDEDMRPVLTAIVNSGAEALFFPLFDVEGALVVQHAKEVDGMDDVTLIVGTAIAIDDFIEAIGEDGRGLYWGAPTPLTSTAHDAMLAAYEQRYGEKPQHKAYTNIYDATNMLLNAIEAVAVQDADGTLHIGRQALRDALYATKDFVGIAGTLSCTKFGDCNSVSFDVMRLDDPTAGQDGLLDNVVYTYNPASDADVQEH